MAGLTPAGLVIKTRSEIYDNIQSKLQSRVDPSWDDVSNNLINIVSNIFAEELSDAWGGVQGAYDAANPATAYDIALDNVADQVDVQRIEATNSSAVLQFTGLVGATVPLNSVITVTDTNERFLTTSALILTNTQFADITFGVSSVNNSTPYSITINGIVNSITSDASATASEIVAALKAAIDINVAGVTTSLPTADTLRVNVTEINSVYSLIVGTGISINSISDLVTANALNTGVVKAPVGSLMNLLVPIANITSVTNLAAATEGRKRETDDEFRVRRFESVAVIGASTDAAITSNVRNLDGVTTAFTVSNREYVVDGDGRPPKSFEVVVDGGDEQAIATTIFKYQPVGIESFGSVTRVVEDIDSIEHTVKFSRPVNRYFKVEVDYTKFSEETFNDAGGESAIANAVVAYGNSLGIGTNVIPQRFFGQIFSNVNGIESLVVRVSYSSDLISWSSFTTSPVAVGRLERSTFDVLRVVVNEV